MGFYMYIIPPGIILENNSEVTKKYCTINDIYINNIMVNGNETVNIDLELYIYESYEERLVRDDYLMYMSFSLTDLINKNISENLWTKCYIKIKEQLLNKNTQYLKNSLNLGENDTIPTQYQYLLEIDDHFN